MTRNKTKIQRQTPFNAVNMPSIDLLDTDIISHADYNTVKLWTTRKFNSRYEKSSNKKDNKALKFLNQTRFFFLEKIQSFSLASQKQRNGIGKDMNELR